MPTKKIPGLDDWVSPEDIASENPSITLSTLEYMTRKRIRDATGFGYCVRFLTPRKKLISRTRFAAWLEGKTVGNKVA